MDITPPVPISAEEEARIDRCQAAAKTLVIDGMRRLQMFNQSLSDRIKTEPGFGASIEYVRFICDAELFLASRPRDYLAFARGFGKVRDQMTNLQSAWPTICRRHPSIPTECPLTNEDFREMDMIAMVMGVANDYGFLI